MNTGKIISTALLVLAPFVAVAQKAEPIKGIVESDRDSAWYAAQTVAWEKEVRRSPKDESAWQNLFDATRYLCMYRGDDPAPQKAIVDRMRRNIPGTFTYHYCCYRSDVTADGAGRDMERAIELGADNVDAYGAFISYLWMSGQFERMYDFGRRYFDSGWYSPGLLQYSYNQLQGLPEGALFFGNGDAELLPKVVLQGGMGVHRDKVVVPMSFLTLPGYVNALCRRLDIEAPRLPERSSDWDAAADSVAQWIIAKSGRPAYFAPTVGERRLQRFSRNLYSEGLVLRYSEQPYDNLAVMKRNVEQRYLLDYLRVSFVPQRRWASDTTMQLNYVVVLGPLLRFYRESGDSARLAWLTGLLREAIDRASCDEERKSRFRQLLDEAR